jgi:hypothetical protein
MQIAELKLELFRRIDSLSEKELFQFYTHIKDFLDGTKGYTLSHEEEKAIEEAEETTRQKYTHEDIVAEAKAKYPNLDIK